MIYFDYIFFSIFFSDFTIVSSDRRSRSNVPLVTLPLIEQLLEQSIKVVLISFSISLYSKIFSDERFIYRTGLLDAKEAFDHPQV